MEIGTKAKAEGTERPEQGNLQQARDAAYAGDYKKALGLITTALEQAPNSATCAIEKAEILCELGRLEDALAVLGERRYDDEAEIAKERTKIETAQANARIVLAGVLSLSQL